MLGFLSHTLALQTAAKKKKKKKRKTKNPRSKTILATQEAETRRIGFEASPRQRVLEILSQKNPS
jgi:hypothetical protein